MENKKNTKKLKAAYTRDITSLYKGSYRPFILSLPQKTIDSVENQPDQLKELFEKNHIQIIKFSPSKSDYWQDALKTLQKKNKPSKETELVDFKKLALLHRAAINILISFLPGPEIVLDEINYIEKKKRPLQRLFTYAKLKQIIEEKNLAHVHLPNKIIAIRTSNNSFVTSEDAEKILNEIIILTAYKTSSDISLKLADDSKDYSLVVFAERKRNYDGPFNKKARKELKKLIKEAPFDVGHGNIFVDENGDAIIIDTEYKGEPAKITLTKLEERYF